MPGQTNVNEHGDPIAATPLMIIEMLSSPGRSGELFFQPDVLQYFSDVQIPISTKRSSYASETLCSPFLSSES